MRLDKFIFVLVLLSFGFFAFRHAQIAPYRTSGILLGQRGPDGGPARVPDVGAPDERQHANYVARLARGEGIPVFNAQDPNLYETYQSHQPPLYYAVAAVWTKLIGQPADSAAAAVPLRALNIMIGVATLLGIRRLGETVSGDPWVGISAAAFAGLMPMFWALHGAVSNDPSLICLCTYTLLGLATGMAHGWNPRIAVLTGLAFGAALWTKTSAVSLLAPIFVAAWFARREPGSRRVAWLPIAVGLGLIAPWWIRNTLLLGDPLALKAFKEAFIGSAQRADMVQMIAQMREAQGLAPSGAAADYWLNWFGWWSARSWIGAFGQMDIFLGPNLYRFALAFVALLCGSAVLALRTTSEEIAKFRPFAWMLGAMVFAVVGSFVQFNLTYFQAQGRYLYPAIAVFAVFLAIGMRHLTKRLPVATCVLVGFMVAADFAILSYIGQEFLKRTLEM